MKKIILPLLILTACGSPVDSAKEVAGDVADNVGCQNAESQFWNSLYRTAENNLPLPDPERVEEALAEQGQSRNFSEKDWQKYVSEFSAQYRTIYAAARNEAGANADHEKLTAALVALETGDREGDVLSGAQDALNQIRQRVKTAEADLDAKCEPKKTNPSATPLPPTSFSPRAADGDLFEQLRTTLDPEIFGARKTITTAYQSCETLELDPLSDSIDDVQGIAITGRHPSGGNVREIKSLSSVQKTHYYLNRTRQQTGAGCFNVYGSPLIYDFGGKPKASASAPTHLNLFANAGSGSKALGVDCSGYIFTALAVAGLKLDPSTELKAVQVGNIPARRYMKPSDGMRCFEAPKMSATLSIHAGDIAATSGHIVMVDEVGDDPFGLARAHSASDCTTSKLSVDGFDFVLSQSSPTKSGIGIDRIRARDYLPEASTFKEGFQKAAVAACKAKFGAAPAAPGSSSMALVRHKKTAACTTKPFTLENESCLYTCPRL